MFLAGEHCDQETLHWVRDRFQVPCLDHWWQTGEHCINLQKLNLWTALSYKMVILSEYNLCCSITLKQEQHRLAVRRGNAHFISIRQVSSDAATLLLPPPPLLLLVLLYIGNLMIKN